MITLKRVLVIGCCGAGKSTFARQLHQKTGLELIHLDQIYWQPNWMEPSKEDWQRTITKTIQKDSWIMDGNYGGTMDMRMARADTIFFLDYPTWRCLFRVIKRVWQYNGQQRPDMPKGCNERLDWDFLHYVAVFNFIKRPGILKKINKTGKHKELYIFKKDMDVQRFLERI